MDAASWCGCKRNICFLILLIASTHVNVHLLKYINNKALSTLPGDYFLLLCNRK